MAKQTIRTNVVVEHGELFVLAHAHVALVVHAVHIEIVVVRAFAHFHFGNVLLPIAVTKSLVLVHFEFKFLTVALRVKHHVNARRVDLFVQLQTKSEFFPFGNRADDAFVQ